MISLTKNHQVENFSIQLDVDSTVEAEDHATLGLGSNSVILEALYDAGTIGSRTWALDQGLTGAPDMGLGEWVDGQVTLGGYDKSRYTGYMVPLSIANDPQCPFSVLVESMVLNNGTGVTMELTHVPGAAKPTPFKSVNTPTVSC